MRGQGCGASSSNVRDAAGVRPRMLTTRWPRIEKQIGDPDALIEQPTRIAAQIEDQRLHSGATQRIDRGLEDRAADSWLKIDSAT